MIKHFIVGILFACFIPSQFVFAEGSAAPGGTGAAAGTGGVGAAAGTTTGGAAVGNPGGNLPATVGANPTNIAPNTGNNDTLQPGSTTTNTTPQQQTLPGTTGMTPPGTVNTSPYNTNTAAPIGNNPPPAPSPAQNTAPRRGVTLPGSTMP